MDLRDGRFSTPTTPSEIVNFDKNTPTTAGVVFDPDMPATTDVLYVSSTNASTWIYQDGGYITYTAPTSSVTTAWTLNGTTIDAGGNKTAAISRTGSITIGADSYFNSIRIGRGGGNSIQNTVVGVNAGLTNTSGANNVFVGTSSGQVNVSGGSNTFVGWGAGSANVTGGNNTYLGSRAGLSSSTVSANTFIGLNSGMNLTTGSNNSFLGTNSGVTIQDGSTALTSATNSLFVGTGARPLANSQTNQIAIGFDTVGKGSNTVNIGNSSITNTYLNGSVTINSAFTLPSTDGAAGYFLKTNGSGTVSWASAAGGLTYFTEAQSTASPNNTVNVDSLTAVASTTDADFAIIPKGNGALISQIPDSTTAGGNKRGIRAVDFQRNRAGATQVASGNESFIGGGSENMASGSQSTSIGGYRNYATSTGATTLGGYQNTANGSYSATIGGQLNQTNNSYAVSGGYSSQANGNSSIALGYFSTATSSGSIALGSNSYANNTSAVAIAGGNATGSNSFAIGANGLSTANASGTGSVALGGGTASGNYSFTTTFNGASGECSVALGGSYGGSGGAGASGRNSFALGEATRATGGYSMAIIANSDTFSHRYRLSHGAYNSSASNGIGSIQGSTLVVAAETSGVTPTTMTTYGGTAVPLVLQNNNVVRVKGSITGKQSGSTNVGVWDIDCVIVRGTTAATTVIAGTPTVSLVVNTGSFGNPTLTADTTNGGLDIKVTGVAATSIRWTAVLNTVETILA